MGKKILGISAYYHDSAAALLEYKDSGDPGQGVDIIAAAQEERFSRKKHDSSFPRRSIEYCLKEAGIGIEQVDAVAFYDKPFIKFERLLETYMAIAPRGLTSFARSMPSWLNEKLFQKNTLIKELEELGPGNPVDWEKRLYFSEHHLSHAASAFYASPFEDATILTLDGVGEWSTSSVSIGKGSSIEMIKEMRFPHSLGLLYSAFTYYLGFKVNSGEYKLMGLAPYGLPKYRDLILNHLMDLKEDGSFRLNLDYFDYCTGDRMTSSKFDRLFEVPALSQDAQLTQKHMDLAASIQAVTEEVMLRMTKALAREYDSKNLCLAGGVALNCVANGRLLREKSFKNIWIQPAAGDAGGALGAALVACYQPFEKKRLIPKNKANKSVDLMKGAFLGPSYSSEEIQIKLEQLGAKFTRLERNQLIAFSVNALTGGKALGWFQGRMEFGPRALGSRSILADPRSELMQSLLNHKVKFRESFRPFAPSILGEDLAQWFEMDCDSPYMLLVADVIASRRSVMNEQEKKLTGFEKLKVRRSDIPAVTHVDYSARVQTVHQDTNPFYYDLIQGFKKATGCPILVNTSFNIRGEPIVCSPEDAYRCFMGTDIDAMVIGDFALQKADQNPAVLRDYRRQFELD